MKIAPRHVAGALLVAAVALLYLPALDGSFQFDDWNVIVRDARVQSFSAWAASMPGMRPILKLSYALNHEFGGEVRAFRVVNVVIHALNVLLVLLLAERLSRRHGVEGNAALGVAFFVALVFALHPAQTEAVTYVSGRSSALVALFCLCALLAWPGGAAGAAAGSRRAAWLAAFFAALALGTKESAAALPLALLLWMFTQPAERRGAAADASLRTSQWRSLWPIALVFVVAAFGFALLAPYRELLASSLELRGPWHNLLAQVEAIPHLAGQLLRIHDMNADPDLQVPRTLSLAAGLRLLAFAALIGGAIAARRRHPALAFGVLWFFVWLLPTHSLLPREDLANDRQLYLALVGPAWLVGHGGWRCLQWLAERLRGGSAGIAPRLLKLKPAPAMALGGVVFAGTAIALGHATLLRNDAYRDEVSFWEDAARRSPRKARTANNLGYAYALACRDAEALAQFERAAALAPADSRARVNRRLLEQGALFREGERDCR